jgi:hypothetical protein
MAVDGLTGALAASHLARTSPVANRAKVKAPKVKYHRADSRS